MTLSRLFTLISGQRWAAPLLYRTVSATRQRLNADYVARYHELFRAILSLQHARPMILPRLLASKNKISSAICNAKQQKRAISNAGAQEAMRCEHSAAGLLAGDRCARKITTDEPAAACILHKVRRQAALSRADADRFD